MSVVMPLVLTDGVITSTDTTLLFFLAALKNFTADRKPDRHQTTRRQIVLLSTAVSFSKSWREVQRVKSEGTARSLSFWRRNYFFFNFSTPVYKM